jgi:hypothetical protein
MTTKFTELLKETVEIYLLKFLPSQYFLVVGNMQRIKILFQHNFRDKSKEDEFTDLSQNLMFLEFLNHQIFKYNTVHGKNRTYRDDPRGNQKSTHSATKSKMNYPINSSVNEDNKDTDEAMRHIELLKESSDTFEFTLPGYLIRVSKIDGIPRMSHDDRYYTVMVFQRYIRRRRTSKKDKDPSNKERFLTNSYGTLPAANLKERQIITNTFTKFIRTNLVVDSKTFLSTTLGSEQRKKILKETRTRKLELQDKKTNALIQSYVQSKEVKD